MAGRAAGRAIGTRWQRRVPGSWLRLRRARVRAAAAPGAPPLRCTRPAQLWLLLSLPRPPQAARCATTSSTASTGWPTPGAAGRTASWRVSAGRRCVAGGGQAAAARRRSTAAWEACARGIASDCVRVPRLHAPPPALTSALIAAWRASAARRRDGPGQDGAVCRHDRCAAAAAAAWRSMQCVCVLAAGCPRTEPPPACPSTRPRCASPSEAHSAHPLPVPPCPSPPCSAFLSRCPAPAPPRRLPVGGAADCGAVPGGGAPVHRAQLDPVRARVASH